MSTTYKRYPPLRRVTHLQFANGIVIDGSQIDQALGDLEENVNNLEPRDVRTGMTTFELPFSWEPMARRRYLEGGAPNLDTQHNYPWLPIRNTKETTRNPQPANSAYGDNGWRLGGSFPDRGVSASAEPLILSQDTVRDATDWVARWQAGAGAAPQPAQANNYHWMYSHYWTFGRSVLLDDVFVYFRTEILPEATWLSAEYGGGATAYEGYAAFFDNNVDNITSSGPGGAMPNHGPVDDWAIQLAVRDVHRPQERARDAVIVHKSKVPANSYWFSEVVLGTHDAVTALSYHDGTPALPNRTPAGGDVHVGGYRDGVLVRLRNLQVPVHSEAQMRFSIVVPWYARRSGQTLEAEELRGWAQAERTPWADWAIHGSVGFREGLASG